MPKDSEFQKEMEAKYGLTYQDALSKLDRQNGYLKKAKGILPKEVLKFTEDRNFVLGQYIRIFEVQKEISNNNGEDISALVFERENAFKVVDDNISYLL